jgi:hypothetical protein
MAEDEVHDVAAAESADGKSNVAAFYHDPPLWVRLCPVDYLSQPPTVDLGSLRETVFSKEVASSIGINITVEGLFTFDFSKWPPVELPGTSPAVSAERFEKLAEATLQRTMIMNAFLALMYTNEAILAKQQHRIMVVTPELLITMSKTGGTFGSERVADLYLTASQSGQVLGELAAFDRRILHRGTMVVSLEVIARTVDDLAKLVISAQQDSLLLADLYLRATKAYQDHNYSSALITYWAIAEKLLQELWRSYQEDNSQQDGVATIDKVRRDILNDSRSFTASVVTEILYFAGRIGHDLYGQIRKVRKKRNDWMHALGGSISGPDAAMAARVSSQLLRQVRDITLQFSATLMLSG